MTSTDILPSDGEICDQSGPAIILARGGSVGIAGKNLVKIGGLSLLGRSILAARAARKITSIYVSTQDAAIAQEALRYGAEIITRPDVLAGATSSSEEGWLHALAQIKAQTAPSGCAVFLQCTSPFTQGQDIDHAIEHFHMSGAGSVFSATRDHGFYWQRNEDGAAFGLSHDPTLPRARRQDTAPQFRESGAIYVVDWTSFEREKTRFCGKTSLIELDHPPLEIDTQIDLDYARTLAPMVLSTVPSDDRLRPIRAVVFDFDGVMTNNRAYVTETGVEMVEISRADGLGLARLRDRGRWKMAILSSEQNPVVVRRAAKLGLECINGSRDKARDLTAWMTAHDVGPEQVLYVGNDLNDLPAFSLAGLCACPSDAVPEILRHADWVLPKAGGRGAVRYLCDRLLACPGA